MKKLVERIRLARIPTTISKIRGRLDAYSGNYRTRI